ARVHGGVVDDGQPAERLGDRRGGGVVGVGGVDLADGHAGELGVGDGALDVALVGEHARGARGQALDASGVVHADGVIGRVVVAWRGGRRGGGLGLGVDEEFVEVLVHLAAVDGDHGLAVVADAVDGGHRDGLELDVAAG